MSILFRGSSAPKAERRWYGTGLIDSIVAQRMGQSGNVAADEATSLVAAGAAINLISSVAGLLPLDEYTGAGPTQKEIRPDLIIRDPAGDRVTSQREWVKMFARDLATWGNAVGRRFYDNGRVISCTLYDPGCLRVVRRGVDTQWFLDDMPVRREDLVIARLHPRTGAALSLSPIAQHASTLGLSWHAQKFLGGFYAEGAHPSAILSADSPIDSEQAQTLKKRFMAAIQGREPVVLNSAVKYEPLQLSPVDADLLASMKWSAAETARIWGPGIPEILGYESGGSMTYSNVVDRRQDLLTFAIDPYLVAIEDALSSLVAQPRFVKFNRGALLRSDIKTRYEAHAIALSSGFLTVDEVRALEDMPPLPGQDGPTPDPTGGIQ